MDVKFVVTAVADKSSGFNNHFFKAENSVEYGAILVSKLLHIVFVNNVINCNTI